MKTKFLTVAAILGIALGTASLAPAAHAVTASTNQPIDAPGWG
jgi:hypothetical protein